VISVGKVDDLFAGRGVAESLHHHEQCEGEEILAPLARRAGEAWCSPTSWTSDHQYGHRNDPAGFAGRSRNSTSVSTSCWLI